MQKRKSKSRSFGFRTTLDGATSHVEHGVHGRPWCMDTARFTSCVMCVMGEYIIMNSHAMLSSHALMPHAALSPSLTPQPLDLRRTRTVRAHAHTPSYPRHEAHGSRHMRERGAVDVHVSSPPYRSR